MLKADKKRPLVFWSGGLDSSYIVWCALANGIDIDTVYVDLNQEESPNEKMAIELLTSKFKSLEGSIIHHSTQDYSKLEYYGDIQCGQAYLWSLVYNMVFDGKFHSHVELGYIRGDDFWHHRDTFDRIQKLLNRRIRNKKLKLKYPLEWMSKTQIIENCEDGIGKDLLEYCV